MDIRNFNIKILLLIGLTLLNNQVLLNQTKGYTVIVQGKVIDVNSGKPVGTQLLFIDEKGKKSSGKSNSIDGTFQQPLNFGSINTVLIKGYLPADNHLTIDLTQKNQYEEMALDIYVKPFEAKTELFNYKFFEPNDSVVINKEEFKELKTFLDFNPNIKLNFVISSYDSWFNKSKRRIEKTDKKGKISYKTVSYSTKEQLSDLLDARIVSLRNELKENNIFIKIDAFVKDLQVVPESKKKMKRAIPGKSRKYEYYTPEFDNVKIVIAK